MMKRLALALLFSLLATLAHAQCSGIFPANTVCGNPTGAGNTPRAMSPSAFIGAAGGSNGQIQYNNGGALGGLTDAAVTARIALFTSLLSGAVPASGGGVKTFLRADSTFSSLGLPLRVVTAAGAVTLTTADYIVVINKTVGAATTANLPGSPAAGDVYIVKDGKGDSAINNITITPAAGNIDGSATFVLGANYGAVVLLYNGTQWNVL